eukprot:TRINITY_DN2897_c0_g1_i5.p4 TRINITY_DN2897_c0_g1~~TRINITY_DN2897_c0_g1_i5.p4  ORF type:complete len:121 (-),score=12.65 TRINITY_DN2897_c0_g1_i5:341-703(-)
MCTRHYLSKLRPVVAQLANNGDWIFAKLFYPDFWWGWSTGSIPLLSLLAVAGGLLGATIFGVGYYLTRRRRSNRVWLLSAFAYAAFVTVLTLCAVGRQHTPFAIGYPSGLSELHDGAQQA